MKVGYRRMVFAGLSCVSFGFFQLSQIDIGASLWMIRVVLAIMGVGMGMTILTLILAVQNAVPRNQLGIATSLGHFTRSVPLVWPRWARLWSCHFLLAVMPAHNS